MTETTGGVGVFGLGRMGSAIARRFAAEGHDVACWTRSNRALDGIPSAPDLPSLVAQSDTLVLSLYDDAAVAEVLDQLLACDLSGKQIIETSTVVPDVVRSRITLITAKGASAVDAPISGGPELVAAGKCGVFVGGDDAAAARAIASLATLSDRVFHVGPLGAGLAMKTINNSMLQIYFAGLDSLMPMAQRAGLPLETVLRILCGGPAGIPMVADRIDKILGKDPEVGFTLSAALKDVGVFERVAQSYGIEVPILTSFAERTQEAIDDGLGEADPALMIARAYERGAQS
ncbi:NAD(P)-dependent oxidoreductase [Cognatishimia sp. SS12]|uniref:NAD(P)-dependent oxidoreductase n=1 Tax=Cognatishimia sp. SS12 TaxID=2979465 RepID=UPI00232C8E90|nr:NAD(P)-dependent oxidoreductase [Cognatishimia sp. SS12]MDC0738958.1 NAD(P)-dependent oxidoreductase [Cognatishimia sp. SS12]